MQPTATTGQPFAVLSLTDGSRFTYDANGNMTLRVEVSATQAITYLQQFDAENRLTVVTNTVTSDVNQFVYDGDGTRLWETEGVTTTVTIGGLLEVAIGSSGRITRTYYYAGGQRVAMRVDDGTTETVYYLQGDHLGSTSLVVNAGGAVVAEQGSIPMGKYGGCPAPCQPIMSSPDRGAIPQA